MRKRQFDNETTSEGQLSHFRKILLAKRAEIAAELRASCGKLTEVSRVAAQEPAWALHDEFVSSRINRFGYDQLKLIEAALIRLDCGEYGTCIDCEKAVSLKRLEAIPWASRCVSCEDRLNPTPDVSFRKAA